ncbi:MAG: PAS domain S-box protein [Bryobacteraceae bacterium]|nr:PAS domain S-box protein [Bryobacteraceae bacterium]
MRWLQRLSRLPRRALAALASQRALAWEAGAAVLAASLALSWSLSRTEHGQLNRHVTLAVQRIASDTAAAIEERLAALDRLARRSEARRGLTEADWRIEASLSFRDIHGLIGLGLFDDKLTPKVFAWERPDPYDQQGQALLAAVAWAARQVGRGDKPALAPPVQLARGDWAVVAAARAEPPGEPSFWLACVLDLRALLERALTRSIAAGFVIEIADDGRVVYLSSSGEGPQPREWLKEATVSAGGRLWTVRVWPREGWVTRRWLVLPFVVSALGAIVAALLAASIHWAQAARRRALEAEATNRELEREIRERRQAQEELARAHELLEERVRERTAELARVNEALRAEILERQRTEETLRASEERYRNLFDSANDMVYTHDLQGFFTSINRAAERITGYTREEALRMNISDVVVPEHLELARQMIVRKLGGESSTTYEIAIRTKDGRRLLVEVSSHLTFEDGKPVGVLGIAREITERKRLEEQLRQSQRIEAIGRLAGGIAHDFNNLLTIIGAYSHMLLMDLPPQHPARNYAEEILAAAERASALTDRLLAFSRRQVVQPVLVDLNEVVRNMVGLLRRMVGQDIELETVLAPDLGKVRADPTQLEQVIMNLVINSRDAMPGGGRVTIETANFLRGPGERGIPGPGSWTLLRVRDTGHGMDAETLSHLFEPFFTTKGPGKGTGLGLSIVYGIVKQSGGEITVESELGSGTVFTIYLPHARAELVPAAPEGEAVPAALQAGGETILLVEDEPGVRKLVRQMLVEEGYQVLEAGNGPETLALVNRYPGRIDLLLTDVVMPQMSGRELAERLRNLRPDLKVMFMTGYTEDSVVRQGISTADVVCLQKPFLPDTLARKVREVLEREG